MARAGNASVAIVVAMVALVLVYSRTYGPDPAGDLARAVGTLAAPAPAAETEQAHERVLDAGAAAVPVLTATLAEGDPARPEELVRALARIGDPAAAPLLTNLLQAHPDALARRAAADALAALADAQAAPLLLARADQDPALTVRQACVIAYADLGHDDVLADLVALLDATTLPELRSSADGSLEVLTGEEFGEDRARAEAWLEAHGNPPPRTSVGGAGRVPGAPLVVDAEPLRVTLERGGADLMIRVTPGMPPAHLLLDMADHGRVLVEVERGAAGLRARVLDIPTTGRSLLRHAELPVPVGPDGSWTIRVPRAGSLVAADLPRQVTIIH